MNVTNEHHRILKHILLALDYSGFNPHKIIENYLEFQHKNKKITEIEMVKIKEQLLFAHQEIINQDFKVF